MLLVMVGLAAMFQAWFTAPVGALTMIAVYRRRIRLEEHALEMALGPAYRAYRADTLGPVPRDLVNAWL